MSRSARLYAAVAVLALACAGCALSGIKGLPACPQQVPAKLVNGAAPTGGRLVPHRVDGPAVACRYDTMMTLRQTANIDAVRTGDLVAGLQQLGTLHGVYDCPAPAPGYEYGPVLLSLPQPKNRHIDVLLDYRASRAPLRWQPSSTGAAVSLVHPLLERLVAPLLRETVDRQVRAAIAEHLTAASHVPPTTCLNNALFNLSSGRSRSRSTPSSATASRCSPARTT